MSNNRDGFSSKLIHPDIKKIADVDTLEIDRGTVSKYILSPRGCTRRIFETQLVSLYTAVDWP